MIRNLICFLVLIGMSPLLKASANPSDNYKAILCQKVFNKLKKAKGLSENDKPTLAFVKELPNPKYRLALMFASTGEAFIEEASYDVCSKHLGKDSINGLAFILAHELAHYTKAHNVRHKFIDKFQRIDKAFAENRSANAASGIAMSVLDSIAQNYEEQAIQYTIRKNEAEADLEAGFIAYLAGFKTVSAGPMFLEHAYTDLKLERSGGNYASLEERKLIIQETGKQVDTLINVFELGNYSMAIKDYETASLCYEFVSKKYEGKNILNNLGVLELLKVMKHLDPSEIKYALPLSIDLSIYKDFMLTRGSVNDEKRLLFDQNLERINKALYYFKKAENIDDNYYAAILNSSIAHYFQYVLNTLNPDWSTFLEDPIYFAETKAIQAKQALLKNELTPNKNALSNVYLQLAIVNDVKANSDRAVGFLEEAIAQFPSNELLKINKKVINNEDSNLEKEISDLTIAVSKCNEVEKLFQTKNFKSLIKEFNNEWNINIEIATYEKGLSTFKNMVQIKNANEYKMYQAIEMRNKNIQKFSVFFETNDDYNFETNCGIKKGDKTDKLFQKYGNPSFKLSVAGGGIIYSYLNKIDNNPQSVGFEGIVFLVDDHSQIKEWVIYSKVIAN